MGSALLLLAPVIDRSSRTRDSFPDAPWDWKNLLPPQMFSPPGTTTPTDRIFQSHGASGFDSGSALPLGRPAPSRFPMFFDVSRSELPSGSTEVAEPQVG